MKDRGSRGGSYQGDAVVRDTRAWVIATALVAGMIAAAVGGFLFVSQVLLAPSPPTPALVDDLDRKSIGSTNAPVTVVVYSDFQ